MDGLSEKQAKKSGFALVEVLIALTVVAILGGIVFPIGKAVLDRVHIMCDKMKLQMLALSYNNLRSGGYASEGLKVGELILRLAGEGIDDTSWYHSTARSKKKSQKITDDRGEVAVKRIVSDWTMVYNLPPDANPETTPVFYSAGLKEDGTWGENGAYGREGGLIAFLNGDVRFVTNANEVLTARGTGRKTGNIHEALPEGSVIANVFTLIKK